MAITFTAKAKNALARFPLSGECCLQAELSSFLYMKGSIEVASGRKALTVVTENPAVARRIFSLFKALYNVNTEIFFRQKTRLKKNNVYLVQTRGEEQIQQILKTLGRLDAQGSLMMGINRKILRRRCCKKAFLRGAFLASGYVSNPDSSYHLELVTDYEGHSRVLQSLLREFHLKGKVNRRKSFYVLYLKGSDAIASFLQVIGAHQALLSFENTRVLKDLRNQVNRLVNFETANLNKTVDAAVKQVEDIHLIKASIGLERLPSSLKSLAELRLAYPEATLKELGAMLTPPLEKSGVNHRFRKLKDIAANLRT